MKLKTQYRLSFQRSKILFLFLEIDRLLERSKSNLELEDKVLLFHRIVLSSFRVKKGNNISVDIPLEAEFELKKRKDVWITLLEFNQIDRKRLYFAYKVMFLLEANRSVTFKSTFPFEGSKKDKEDKLALSISRGEIG